MPPQETSSIGDVLGQVQTAAESGSLISLLLHEPSNRRDDLPSRIDVRPVVIRGEVRFQCSVRIGRQEKHENLTAAGLVKNTSQWFPGEFRRLMLHTAAADVAAHVGRRGEVQVKVTNASRLPVSTSHDREKQYLIPEGVPCPFLAELGVMNSQGVVLKAKHHKFRQINRYVEMVDDVYPQLPAEGVISVCDFGCGLSYLTFAVHHLLTVIRRREIDFVGIDRNRDVIRRSQQAAERLHLEGLRFHEGEIDASGDPSAEPQLHLAISLHACDTATDAALAHAVGRRANVILAAPCCQHELFSRLQGEFLPQMTRHGILKERFAAMATDALRAAALEAAGYRTQVLEFIETEHTPKNLLIRAVRREGEAENLSGQKQATYQEFKAQLGLGDVATDRILAASGNAASLRP